MFKERLGETLITIVAVICTLIIIGIIVGAVYLTTYINANIPGFVILGFIIIYILYNFCKWVNWQFIEPFKQDKTTEEEEKGEE